MSNHVVKVLLFASSLSLFSGSVMAEAGGWAADCATLDSAAAANTALTKQPGFCVQINNQKAVLDAFPPPGACADYVLATFTLGQPAVLQNCGGSATIPSATGGTTTTTTTTSTSSGGSSGYSGGGSSSSSSGSYSGGGSGSDNSDGSQGMQ